MGEETYNFTQARARLEEIVTQVRKKDTSLEQSLDMLEEGVRLANACTELIDHTEWRAAAGEGAEPDESAQAPATDDAARETAEAEAQDPGDTGVIDVVVVEEEVVVTVVETVEADKRDFEEADNAWADEEAVPDEE